jgi:hypothetical protein
MLLNTRLACNFKTLLGQILGKIRLTSMDSVISGAPNHQGYHTKQLKHDYDVHIPSLAYVYLIRSIVQRFLRH